MIVAVPWPADAVSAYFQRFPLFLPFHRGGCEQSPPQGSCFFSSLGADARRPPSFFTRRYRMPCAAKKRRAAWRVSFFVITHRFCCLHSRTSQGRGSVRGEPLTGSPTRVQSPARRRSLLRSKSAAPKKKDTHMGVFLFWQAAPIKISAVFLVFSMVSAFLARFLELAASYCWLLLCNQKRYCGFYGIWCGLHDSVSDLHFDGFPALCGSGHKSACSAQHG